MSEQKIKSWILGYGLGGSFGGISNYEAFIGTEDEANRAVYQECCEEFERYSQHGICLASLIEENDGNDDSAWAQYEEERESWLEYSVEPYSQERANELEELHFFEYFNYTKEELEEAK